MALKTSFSPGKATDAQKFRFSTPCRFASGFALKGGLTDTSRFRHKIWPGGVGSAVVVTEE